MKDAVSQPIREVLAALTKAWRSGRTQDIRRLLHPSVVFVLPGFSARAEGPVACIATYDEFLAAALVLRYDEEEAAVDVFGETAVATFRWEMAWEMGGQRSEEGGHDVYVLLRQEGRWLIAWRTLLPAPPS
jgi:ketosteroid isomerase-like protein